MYRESKNNNQYSMGDEMTTLSDFDKVVEKAEEGDPVAIEKINQPSFWINRAAAAVVQKNAGQQAIRTVSPCDDGQPDCGRRKNRGLGRQPVRHMPQYNRRGG